MAITHICFKLSLPLLHIYSDWYHVSDLCGRTHSFTLSHREKKTLWEITTKQLKGMNEWMLHAAQEIWHQIERKEKVAFQQETQVRKANVKNG